MSSHNGYVSLTRDHHDREQLSCSRFFVALTPILTATPHRHPTISGSTITRNAGHGIDINRTNNVNYSAGTRGSVLIDNNTLAANALNAIDILMDGAANPAQRFDITNNTITGSVSGVNLVANNATMVRGQIVDNDFAGNSGNTIDITLNENTTLGNPLNLADPFAIAGNVMTSGGGTGIVLNVNDAAVTNVVIGESASRRMAMTGLSGGVDINDASTTAFAQTYSITGADFNNMMTGNVTEATFADGDRTLNIDDITSSGGADFLDVVANNANFTSSITNVIVASSGAEGVDLNLANTGDTTISISNVTIDETMGDDGIDVFSATQGTTTITAGNVNVTNSAGDGIVINKESGGIMNAVFTDVDAIMNNAYGIRVMATNDDAGRNLFSFGSFTGNESRINNNQMGGVLFEQTATAISQLQTAANPDVRVDENLENPATAAYFDLGSRDIVQSTFNVLNAEVQGNGGDGITMNLGSNTLTNSQLAGLAMGANGGFDINITPIVSADPPSSVDSAVMNADVLVFDPVAHLDLVLGAADLTGDGFAETVMTNPEVGNTGEQIQVNFLGADFGNTDPFKNDRAVRLAGQVQVENELNASNSFMQLFTQDIEALFSGQGPVFNRVPVTFFPDTIVP